MFGFVTDFEQLVEKVVENQVLIDTWDQKNVDARMIIYCNIEPKLQVLLEGCRTAADMWDRLILQFAQAAAAKLTFEQVRQLSI